MHRDEAPVRALTDIDLQVHSGEVLGIVGESGSGKTTLARSLIRLLPETAVLRSGTILWRGNDILKMNQKEVRRLRGGEIALMFQEPAAALNPVMRVGDQIREVVRAHTKCSRAEGRLISESLLERVRLPEASRIYDAYPHQLSGGQCQRIVMAQALAGKPSLIVADEPTSSLDTTTQAGVLALFRELKDEVRTAMLIITHDLSILPRLADRVVVLNKGEVVEQGPVRKICEDPVHPYTRLLIRSVPHMERVRVSIA